MDPENDFTLGLLVHFYLLLGREEEAAAGRMARIEAQDESHLAKQCEALTMLCRHEEVLSAAEEGLRRFRGEAQLCLLSRRVEKEAACRYNIYLPGLDAHFPIFFHHFSTDRVLPRDRAFHVCNTPIFNGNSSVPLEHIPWNAETLPCLLQACAQRHLSP